MACPYASTDADQLRSSGQVFLNIWIFWFGTELIFWAKEHFWRILCGKNEDLAAFWLHLTTFQFSGPLCNFICYWDFAEMETRVFGGFAIHGGPLCGRMNQHFFFFFHFTTYLAIFGISGGHCVAGWLADTKAFGRISRTTTRYLCTFHTHKSITIC